MNIKFNIILMYVGMALFVIGIIVLLNATNIGMGLASREIISNGGVMDTDKYYFIMKSYTLSYQIAGAICSVVGGFGALLLVLLRGNGIKESKI